MEEKGIVPDLLPTDAVMPGMSGSVLAKWLWKQLPGLKVLYMSGYTDNTIVHHGELDPGTPLIPKPMSLSALSRKLRELLEQRA